MKKLLNYFKNEEKPNKLDWILYGILVLVLLVNFAYVDILVTSTHGVSMWDAILKEGNILKFYELNSTLVIRGMTASAAYDLPIYFIFALWNFPIWIVKELLNVDFINNPFTLIWIKLLPLVFLGGCGILVKKICEDIKINKKWIPWVMFLFLTCPLISTSVILISQYDIIAVFFILLGIRAYINNDRNKFVIWFMIAIPMKLFAVFIFLPLLLIKEKNYLKAFVYTASSFFLLIICRIIQGFMPTYGSEQGGFYAGMAGRILEGDGINLAYGNAPYFVIVFVAVCIYCFFKNTKTKEEFDKLVIWSSYVIYSSFMIFCFSYPYWIIYFLPFMIIMIFQNTKHFKINLFLESILCFTIIFIQMYEFPWCYTSFMMKGTIIPFISHFEPIIFFSPKTFINNLPLNIIPSLRAVWLVCITALAIINFPRENTESKKIEIDKLLIYARLLVPFMVALVLIIKYFE